jgi:hypothetical protein
MKEFLMLYDYFLLNGNYYIVRLITMKNNETVMISTIDLNESLFNKKGQYISYFARLIDEQIFYFVNKDEILLPENALSELVYQEALS